MTDADCCITSPPNLFVVDVVIVDVVSLSLFVVIVVRRRRCSSSSLFVVVVVRCRRCSSSSSFVVVVVRRRCCLLSSLFVDIVVSRRRCLSSLLFVVVVVRRRCCLSSLLFVVVVVRCCRLSYEGRDIAPHRRTRTWRRTALCLPVTNRQMPRPGDGRGLTNTGQPTGKQMGCNSSFVEFQEREAHSVPYILCT